MPRTGPRRGSSDLRKGDFAGARSGSSGSQELAPRALGFVGKEAYRGPFGGRPQHGLQERRLGETALFVLPSTSPANAAVPWDERLRWFCGAAGARSVTTATDARGRPRHRPRRGRARPAGAVRPRPWRARLGNGRRRARVGRDARGGRTARAARGSGARRRRARPVHLDARARPRGRDRLRRAARALLPRPTPGSSRCHAHVGAAERRGGERGQVVDDRRDPRHPGVAVFAPRRLGTLLRGLLDRGSPAEPIDVGV